MGNGTNTSTSSTMQLQDVLVCLLFSLGITGSACGQDLRPRLAYEHHLPTESLHGSDSRFLLHSTAKAWAIELNLELSGMSASDDLPAAGWLVLGGAAGWGVGLAGGALLGEGINEVLQVQSFGAGTLTGAALGVATMTPLGVHLANGRKGSYTMELLTSAAVTVATVLLMGTVEDGYEPFVLGTGAAVQIGLSTLIECETSP